MKKFCGKCGTKLDKKGKCPNCDNKSQNQVTGKNNNSDGSSTKKGLAVCLVLLLLILISVATFILLIHFDVIDNPFSKNESVTSKDDNVKPKTTEINNSNLPDDNDSREKYVDTHTAEDFTVEPIDAEEFFGKNSTIVSKVKVDESNSIHSEAQAFANLTGRGFTQYPIMADYDMDGNLLEGYIISETSNQKHPSYFTYYVTDYGEIWTVFEINGVVMANPVTYNQESESESQVLIAETKSTTSYDSTSGQFYVTVPNEDTVDLKTVERIDAQTLNEINIGALDYEEE